jgi:hypothetical protein
LLLLPVAVNDPCAIEVVRGQFDTHTVARKDPDTKAAHLAGYVTKDHTVHVVELHTEHRIRQGLDDLALELDLFFLWHRW